MKRQASCGTVYYWVKPVKIGVMALKLFTAVSSSGLIMSGLDDKEKLLNELQSLVRRYLPGFEVTEQEEPNIAVIKEFQEYFSGERQSFSFPLSPLGTEFQRRVWRALEEIPYGETRSYSDIANKIGCTQGQRAVGLANNKNPLGIVVPCHRVIGKNGHLVGYASGLEKKSILLNLESGRTG